MKQKKHSRVKQIIRNIISAAFIAGAFAILCMEFGTGHMLLIPPLIVAAISFYRGGYSDKNIYPLTFAASIIIFMIILAADIIMSIR